ncbi:MAG: OmpA family protein, partial [Reichenbachiella sp.]
LFLTPIEKGVAISLNNIFFEFDRSDLRTSSYAELDRILKLLESDKINSIEISGHTDSVGDDDYNLELSKRRAWSVYSYFIANGIRASRLESVGYGETMPVAPNDTADNRRKNRRVEFKIID